MAKENKKYTLQEIKKHNDKESVWILIHGSVYDVTKFLEEHPGGEKVLLDQAGKHATKAFEDIGHSSKARDLMKQYKIGELCVEDKQKISDIEEKNQRPIASNYDRLLYRMNQVPHNYKRPHSGSTVNAPTAKQARTEACSYSSSAVHKVTSSTSKKSIVPDQGLQIMPTSEPDQGLQDTRKDLEMPKAVIIDGSNVAREHGKRCGTFSSKGIYISVQHFKRKGIQKVMALIPESKKNDVDGIHPTKNPELLDLLWKSGNLIYTPTVKFGNYFAVPYDDRFILQMAFDQDGFVLSNDLYRDLSYEKDSFKKVINERLMTFSFDGDNIIVPRCP